MSAPTASNSRYYILFLLLAVQIVAQVDRMAMSMLVEPIKADFSLSDAEAGFLLGPAFVVLYAVLGVGFGIWADKGNRRNLIGYALVVWSVLTMACGMAVGFITMALARMGVAVGEAGANPPAYSMMSDLFDEHERGTAIGVYSTSSNIGILVGFAAAGAISEAFGWRNTFLLFGIPGILLALVMFATVREPARRQIDIDAGDQSLGLMATARHMLSQQTIRHLLVGGALTAFVGLGFSNWLPAYFERTFVDLDRTTIGIGLGVVIGIVGGAGTFLGGFFSDRVALRDIRWRLWIACIAIAVGWPIGILSLSADDYRLVLALMALPAFVALFHLATLFALVQQLVASRMRATATAILMLFTNLLGGGLGPYFVGWLSDQLVDQYGERSLAIALSTLIVFAFWGGLHFFMANRHLVDDVERNRALGHT